MQILSNPGSRALRKGRTSLCGQIYLVTVACQRRERRFCNPRAAQDVSRMLHSAHTWNDAVNLAWVLMPDHWHALVQLGPSWTLSSVMQRVKSVTARATNEATARRGRVWQAGYHDRALRHEDSLVGCARYIVANPVRAGLVTRVRDYPYWNAVWL
jgi:REP element-mobilizing transposase RayT